MRATSSSEPDQAVGPEPIRQTIDGSAMLSTATNSRTRMVISPEMHPSTLRWRYDRVADLLGCSSRGRPQVFSCVIAEVLERKPDQLGIGIDHALG